MCKILNYFQFPVRLQLEKEKKKHKFLKNIFNGCIGPVQMDVLAEMGMGIH